MNQEPIFILGAHKSGTSLLRNLFDGHSNLFVIPIEAHFFQHNGYWIDYGIRRQYPDVLEKTEIINNYINWIEKSNTVSGDYSDGDTRGFWRIDNFKEKLSMKENYQNIKDSIENYVESMYNSLYEKKLPENIRIIEKSVENAEFASELKKIFPKAKFVHIIRNPYSNLVSIRKFKSQNSYPFLKKIIRTLENSYYYLEKNQNIFEEDYLTIRYEDLVRNSKKIIDKIVDFTQISREDILYKPTVQGKNWGGNSTTGENFDGISTARLSKWESEINPLEINIVNEKFSFIVNKYNYDLLENKNAFFPVQGESLSVYIGNRILYKYFL